MAYQNTDAGALASRNLNYAYYVEYFQDLDLLTPDSKSNEQRITERNEALLKMPAFPPDQDGLESFASHSLLLKTTYPGLVSGLGTLHMIGSKSEFSLGFLFDYVTGSPYISGSSVKGVLKSAFQNEALIQALLGDPSLDVKALRDQIFEGLYTGAEGQPEEQPPHQRDLFLDAFPCKGGAVLEEDVLAPHGNDVTKSPTLISFVKVKPNVVFRFRFRLRDAQVGSRIVTAQEKLDLFQTLLMLFGAGAKTNVGYGAFAPAELGG